MLALLVSGMMDLGAVAGIAALITLERVATRPEHAARAAGIVLLAAAALRIPPVRNSGGCDNARNERKTSTSGQVYFVLKAKNGEIIGSSEMYSSVGARDAGIDAVKRDAPAATTNDLTK
jgi:uncharacterized protein YegP (UPF0339 family)